MLDKTSSLRDAAAVVQPGHTLALGGMTIYRRPMAYVRALLTHNPQARDLTLLCFTAGMESDLLVGAGRVKAVRSCYFGLETFGLAPMFTEAAGRGALEIIEESEVSLALGIRAALSGVGFMPSRAWIGTDMLALRPDVSTVQDPYSGEQLVAFPAIQCDVAVIHALQADPSGNAVIGGNVAVDPELALLARTTIVTAEEIVPRLDKADIPAPLVDWVVSTPNGARPTSCHPLYPLAGGDIMRYVDRCNAGEFEAFVAEWTEPGVA
ncbi:MAG: CoA transferase subunit A [Anaerolineales bacterium]